MEGLGLTPELLPSDLMDDFLSWQQSNVVQDGGNANHVPLHTAKSAKDLERERRLAALEEMGYHVGNETQKVHVKFVVSKKVVASRRIEWRHVAQAAVDAEDSGIDLSHFMPNEEDEISDEIEDKKPMRKGQKRRRSDSAEVGGRATKRSRVEPVKKPIPTRSSRKAPAVESEDFSSSDISGEDNDDAESKSEVSDDIDEEEEVEDEDEEDIREDNDNSQSESEEVLIAAPRTARQQAMVKAATTKKSSLFEEERKPKPARGANIKNLSLKEQQKRERANRRRTEREIGKMEEEKNIVVAQLLNKVDIKVEVKEPPPKRTDAVTMVKNAEGTTYILPSDQSALDFLQDNYLVNPPKANEWLMIDGPKNVNSPKCAGPGCTNSRKYTHSELKLPICSLGCYKAISSSKV